MLLERAEPTETRPPHPPHPHSAVGRWCDVRGEKCSQMKVVETEPEVAATEKHQLEMIRIIATIIRYSNDPSDWLLIG